VGGSVAGLTAALLLARTGHEVTVVERDTDPLGADPEEAWAVWRRPGVPQLRQLHIFNSRGRTVLRQHLPDVHDAWLEAGAVETPLPADPEVVRTNCRRTTFEWVLRRAANAHEAGLRIVTGVSVTGARLDDGTARRRVTAVCTATGRFPADMVLDASGRRGVLAYDLTRQVDTAVRTSTGPCGGVAATRWYRTSKETPPQTRADLGYAACVLTPADAGMFSITFGFQRHDRALWPLRRAVSFEAALAAVEPLAREVARTRAEPVTDVLYRGEADNHLRRIDPSGGVSGVALVGDAAAWTNPGYGRGIGLALASGAAAAVAVDEADGDPDHLTAAMDRFAETDLAPWYEAAVVSDRVRRQVVARSIAGEPLSSIGGPGDDPDVRFARLLPSAAERDPALQRRFQRVWHLLDPPSALWGDPAVRARVEEIGVPETPDWPMPDHDAMRRIVAGTGP
jgi:2-polyprenyl-6-methoxyphenol hydroxylase-like FAD-dependent oxidoreductase